MGKNNKVDTRLSDNDYKSLVKIREMGELDDNSSAVRFCIKFTTSILKVIPVNLVENLINTYDESEATTSAEGAAPQNLQSKESETVVN